MVVYCILDGCKNNDNNKETDSRNVLFHVFSSNPVLKARWLKVIGRFDWEPPDNAGICNDHFNAFRLNSSFEGSLVEVCRICLATNDVTLYSLQYGKLKQYMDTILPINNDSCLPQFVCFECAVHLRKCYNMIKKSETSQAILFEIFLQNGEITKSLVKKLNRENLELKSPLQPHSVTPTYVFDYQFNYENNLSDLINIQYIYDLKEIKTDLEIKSESDSVQTYDSADNDENLEQYSNCVMQSVNDQGNIDDETDVEHDKNITIFYTDDENNSAGLSEDSTDGIFRSADENNENEKIYANCVIKSVSGHVSCDDNKTDIEKYKKIPVIYIADERNSIGSKKISDDENNKISLRNGKKRVQKGHVKRRKITKQTIESEEFIAKHFNVVNLMTLQEKIHEWKKAMENPSWMKTDRGTNEIYKCEVCSKLFVNRKPYEQHRVFHDPSYGTTECPVCKLRYKNKRTLKNHMLKHCKKFNCKVCQKSFLYSTSARKHCLYHMGQVYNCTRCSFSSRHRSTLSVHVQKAHSHAFACELCGRACVNRTGLQRHHELQHPGEQLAPESGEMFPCEECNLKFNSENALRVHLLTSVQHRDATCENSALQNTCKLCGASFPTYHELRIHKKSVHRLEPRYPRQFSSNDKCTLKCECCDETLHSRRDYYFHMLRKHPGHKYQPHVGVICPTCGKTFQNEYILRRHELRHGSPRERCEQCDRMFYDKRTLASHHARVHNKDQSYCCNVCGRIVYNKYALTQHQRIHSGERTNCKVCGRAFNSKANLTRHMLIHTGEMPYQCSICDRKFTQSGSLKLHVRTVHLKMPHPPRKKRKPNTQKTEALDNDTNT